VAELDEREGEVDGDGGLADAAFAAGDGDEIFYAWDGVALGLGHGCWWHLVTLSPRSFEDRKAKFEIRNSKNKTRYLFERANQARQG
jgi:hypothetical protein